MAELVQYYGTGRRKTAIARVYLRPGSGDFKVNGRAFEEYFVTPAQRSAAKSPLASSDMAATFNVIASVLGGGVRGQADAVKLGYCPRADAVQCRTAQEAEGRGHGQPRFARQRAQEVRTEGRSQALPVQQEISTELRGCPRFRRSSQCAGIGMTSVFWYSSRPEAESLTDLVLGVQFFPCLAARGREWQSGAARLAQRMQTKEEVHWLPLP